MMHDLVYGLKQLSHKYWETDASFQTRADRRKILMRLGKELVALGYRQLQVQDLQRYHGEALLRQWKARGLRPGTIKNLLAVLRWWAYHVGKPGLFPASNDTL